MEQTTIEVWMGLGAVIGTLILMASMLWASNTMVKQAHRLWQVLRGYRDKIEAGIDEPTDPFVRELARISTLPPELWSALLTGFVRALADGLTKWLNTPLDESDTRNDYEATTSYNSSIKA